VVYFIYLFNIPGVDVSSGSLDSPCSISESSKTLLWDDDSSTQNIRTLATYTIFLVDRHLSVFACSRQMAPNNCLNEWIIDSNNLVKNRFIQELKSWLHLFIESFTQLITSKHWFIQERPHQEKKWWKFFLFAFLIFLCC